LTKQGALSHLGGKSFSCVTSPHVGKQKKLKLRAEVNKDKITHSEKWESMFLDTLENMVQMPSEIWSVHRCSNLWLMK